MITLSDRRTKCTNFMVHIYPTLFCLGNCSFCFLQDMNKKKPNPSDWGKLLIEVNKFFTLSDLYQREEIIITIIGGEVFADELLELDGYVDYLKELYNLILSFVGDREKFLSIRWAISLENVSDNGIELAKYFRKNGCKIVSSFSYERIENKNKRDRFFKNLENLGTVDIIEVGHFQDWSKTEPYLEFLSKYARICADQPIMLNNMHFHNNETGRMINMDGHIQCTAHRTVNITDHGLFTCPGILQKPDWISNDEWSKLSNDQDYLENGYEQVIEWYGCNKCDKQNICPGMCWISYYAQKELYNNKVCLYKVI